MPGASINLLNQGKSAAEQGRPHHQSGKLVYAFVFFFFWTFAIILSSLPDLTRTAETV
jgi:hypothetical protein